MARASLAAATTAAAVLAWACVAVTGQQIGIEMQTQDTYTINLAPNKAVRAVLVGVSRG